MALYLSTIQAAQESINLDFSYLYSRAGQEGFWCRDDLIHTGSTLEEGYIIKGMFAMFLLLSEEPELAKELF